MIPTKESVMKLLSTSDVPAKYLARIALDCKLYQCKTWNLYRALQEVNTNKEIARYAEIMLLSTQSTQNSENSTSTNSNFVGIIYHNDAFPIFCSNTQIYVKEEERKKGYGKYLYQALNKRLIELGTSKILEVGYGAAGSALFWQKMSLLPDTLKQEVV